jgi:Domain of unknown function (DUF1707)
MAGLEHEMAAGGGRGRLRASHADRERVIGTLKAAYAYGLVTKDEFDARVSQTFAARTYAELAVITADIPAGLAPAPPPLRPAPAKANPPVAANVTAGDRAIMAAAIVAGLAMVASLFASPVSGSPLAGLLFLGGAGSAFVSLLLLGIQMRSQRTKRRSGELTLARALLTGRYLPRRQNGSPPPASHGGARPMQPGAILCARGCPASVSLGKFLSF